MNQDQLHYTLALLAEFDDFVVVKTYMLLRFCGIHVAGKDRYGWRCFFRSGFLGLGKTPFTLQAWQVECMIRQFDYIGTYEGMGVRLDDVRGLHAADADLHGVRFIDYLSAEKYYQAYCIHKEDRFLLKLARELYRRKDGSRARRIRLDKAQTLGVFLWFSYAKDKLAKTFPHFFKKVGAEDGGDYDFMASVNVQVRALTGGDLTKEQQVFDTDCWRALTELDAKAREAGELRKRMEQTRKK